MKKGVFIILGLALIVIVIVTVIFFMTSKTNEPPKFDYLAEGKTYLESKSYSKATQCFKKEILQNTTNSNAYIELSNIYILKNDLTSAIDLLLPVSEGTDNSQKINYQIANVYYLSKDYVNAEIYLLKVSPEYVVSDNLRLGSNDEVNSKDVVKLFMKTLNKLDKNDEAKKLLETYLTNSSSTDAYLNILASLLNYGALDVANGYYSKVVSFDDKDGIETVRKISDELKSVLDKTKSDTKGESLDTNKANVARLLIAYDFNTPAINILSDVISRNLEFDLLYTLRGVGYYQKGDYEKALLDLEKASSLNPSSEETLVYLARVYDGMENVQKSIETFEQAVRIFPNNELNLHDYARMLYKEEMYSQCVNQYLKLIAKNTAKQSEYRVELAKIYLDKVANYSEVLVITNELVNKWSGYAEVSDIVKADIKTLEIWAGYMKLQNTKPEDVDIDSLIVSLNESLVMDPTNIRTNFYLGELYITNKDFTKAREMLENVINYELDNEFTSEAKNLIETKIK